MSTSVGVARQGPNWRLLAVLAPIAGIVLVVAATSFHVALVARGHIHTPEDVPERRVGMVLGARAHPHGPSGFLAARLDVALELYHADRISIILVSGDGLARSNHETQIMRDYLIGRGVPAEDVWEDPAGFDTYDSCARARSVHGVEEMTIISQEYHLPRALTICRSLGIDAVGVGDTSTRDQAPLLYMRNQLREAAAVVKMEWDLLTRRDPEVGER